MITDHAYKRLNERFPWMDQSHYTKVVRRIQLAIDNQTNDILIRSGHPNLPRYHYIPLDIDIAIGNNQAVTCIHVPIPHYVRKIITKYGIEKAHTIINRLIYKSNCRRIKLMRPEKMWEPDTIKHLHRIILRLKTYTKYQKLLGDTLKWRRETLTEKALSGKIITKPKTLLGGLAPRSKRVLP